ncbi:MAG TPA: hypothetical protein VE404_10690, partial [Verrucomicrobiae bacterium]|nr:hypothetical protein [Verrucomicrobiae bacterium]
PAAAFLIGTPYALFDLGNFLRSVGAEVHVYRVTGLIGNATDQIEPGLTQLLLQIRTVGQNLGWVASGLAALGVIAVLLTRAGAILLVYPAIYLALMAGTRVPLHRNFVVLYPFAAVAFGAAGVVVWRAARRRTEGRAPARRAVRAAATLLAGIALAPPLAAAAVAWRSARAPESRTRAAILLARRAATRTGAALPVGVEEELRIHGQDLARLEVPYEVAPYLDLLCHPERYSIVALAGRHGAFFTPNRGPLDLFDNDRAAAIFRTLESVGQGALDLDTVSIDPEVRIVEPALPAGGGGAFCVGDVPPRELRSRRSDALDDRGALTMFDAGTVRSPGFLIPAGRYAFNWRARGTRAAGEFARIEATVTAAAESNRPVVVGAGTFDTNSFAKEFALAFELRDDALVVLDLDFVNDDNEPATHEDRNVHLEAVRLLRLR